MKVKDLLILLQQCDYEAEVVCNNLFSGYKTVNVLVRHENIGDVNTRISSKEVRAVELMHGNVSHMEGQGMDVLSFEERVPCPCNQCRSRNSE